MHIELNGRTFVALRLLGRRPAGTRGIFHAVSPHCRMALCSVEPGISSGWAEPPAAEVTCPGCTQRLEVWQCTGRDKRLLSFVPPTNSQDSALSVASLGFLALLVALCALGPHCQCDIASGDYHGLELQVGVTEFPGRASGFV